MWLHDKEHCPVCKRKCEETEIITLYIEKSVNEE